MVNLKECSKFRTAFCLCLMNNPESSDQIRHLCITTSSLEFVTHFCCFNHSFSRHTKWSVPRWFMPISFQIFLWPEHKLSNRIEYEFEAVLFPLVFFPHLLWKKMYLRLWESSQWLCDLVRDFNITLRTDIHCLAWLWMNLQGLHFKRNFQIL